MPALGNGSIAEVGIFAFAIFLITSAADAALLVSYFSEKGAVPKLASYLGTHWVVFLSTALAGFGLPLALYPWIARWNWPQDVLFEASLATPMGVYLLAAVVLIFSWKKARVFWYKLGNSWALPQPPLQTVHIVSTGLLPALFAMAVILRPPLSDSAKITLLAISASWSLWFASSWMFAGPEPPEPTELLKTVRPYEGTFSDDPIGDLSEDLLNREHFLSRLHKQVVTLPIQESFVFGLYGPWGIGKSSILKILTKRFKTDQDVILVDFNPWYFSNSESIIDGFYDGIERSLNAIYSLSNFKRQIFRYSRLLSLGVHSSIFGLTANLPEGDPQVLRYQLGSFIEQLGRRLVIVIDDIDRLDPAELLVLLKLVRLAGRIRGTTFILSFDELVVRKMLRRAQIDADFLDKIVQMPIVVPFPEQNDIDRFLLLSDEPGPQAHRSAIDRMLDEAKLDDSSRRRFDNEFLVFYLTHLSRLIKTLRQAKRFFNSLRPQFLSVVGEVDTFDFCLLTALQVFFPEIYEDVRTNRDNYVPPKEADQARRIHYEFSRKEKQEERKKRAEAILARIDDSTRRSVASEILKALFKELAGSLEGTTFNRARNPEVQRAQKRLSDPECFDRYFLFQTPRGELQDTEVEGWISRWNEMDSSEIEADVLATFAQLKASNRLQAAVIALLVFSSRFQPSTSTSLVLALAGRIDLFATKGTSGRLTYHRVDTLFLQLVERNVPDHEKQQTLIALLNSIGAEFLHLAVLIVTECDPDRRNSLDRVHQHCDVQALRSLVGDRLEETFVQKRTVDLFALQSGDWIFVAAQWGLYFQLSSADTIVFKLLMEGIERRPRRGVELVVSWFRGGIEISSLKTLAKLIDPARVVQIVKQTGGEVFHGAEEREIFEAFSHAVEATVDQKP